MNVTPNKGNVFERGITLPGRTDGSLAAATPCRLQLRTVLGRSANKFSGDYHTLSALWIPQHGSQAQSLV
jgi:hypothetical protein